MKVIRSFAVFLRSTEQFAELGLRTSSFWSRGLNLSLTAGWLRYVPFSRRMWPFVAPTAA